jgi:hypothetical protein
VEHLATGEARHFASLEDLREFLLDTHDHPRRDDVNEARANSRRD